MQGLQDKLKKAILPAVGVTDGSIEICEDFASDSTPKDRFIWLHSFHEHTYPVTKIEGEENTFGCRWVIEIALVQGASPKVSRSGLRRRRMIR